MLAKVKDGLTEVSFVAGIMAGDRLRIVEN